MNANLQTEEIGVISSGVCSFSWSPDFELVVIITLAESILTMSQDFEILAEVPLIPAEGLFSGMFDLTYRITTNCGPFCHSSDYLERRW